MGLFSAKVLWVTMQCLMDTPDMSHGWWIASYFVFTFFAMTAPDHKISENDSAEKEKEIKRLQSFIDEFEKAMRKAMRKAVQKLKQTHEEEIARRKVSPFNRCRSEAKRHRQFAKSISLVL